MNQNDMSNRALLNRIMELEDKFVKLKRMYEDAINNIDENNFATSLVKKIGDMETKINISAEGVTSQVSNELVESMIRQKAGEITAIVTEAKDKMQAQIKLTADAITNEVEGQIKDAVTNEVEVQTAEITTTMGSIKTSVEAVKERQDAADGEMEEIKTDYSNIQQTANEISSKVGMSFCNVVDCYLDSDGWKNSFGVKIEFHGNTSKVYHYTNDGKEKYDYYNGSDWETVDGSSLFSCFTQTKDGFKLKGDFTSTTNEGTTVDISGTRIDVYNKQSGEGMVPKLSMGFENDGTNNEQLPFLRMGSGDGTNSVSMSGFKLYEGQGVIYKAENQFAMVYLYDHSDDSSSEENEQKYAGVYIGQDNNGKTYVRILGDELQLDGASDISAKAVFG